MRDDYWIGHTHTIFTVHRWRWFRRQYLHLCRGCKYRLRSDMPWLDQKSTHNPQAFDLLEAEDE